MPINKYALTWKMCIKDIKIAILCHQCHRQSFLLRSVQPSWSLSASMMAGMTIIGVGLQHTLAVNYDDGIPQNHEVLPLL